MSPATESDLGRLAVARGLLTPAQLDECLRLRADRGGTLHDHLLERGYVDAIAWRQLGRRVAGAGAADRTVLQEAETPEIFDEDTAPLAPTGEDGTPFGRYRLLGEVGRGGMGIVYRAFDPVLGRDVALKMLLAEGRTGDESSVERFLREARSTARLRHPNIVQILDVGAHDDRHYFTMEFVEGSSLERVLEVGRESIPRLGESSGDWLSSRPGRDPLARYAPSGPFGLREVLLLVRSIARALHSAHQQGLVHRDIKPANILIDSSGTPLLTDFGLAKQLDDVSGLTLSGVLVGTPRYMSPEQVRGKHQEVGPASDVYALGAVLYELLAGRPPFDGESLPELLIAILRKTPPPPSDLGDLPREVDVVCLKALEKDPDDRYESAEAMAHDLEAILAGTPIEARPGRAMRRKLSRGSSRGTSRVARRRRSSPAVAIVAVFASLSVGLIAIVLLRDAKSDPVAASGATAPDPKPAPPPPERPGDDAARRRRGEAEALLSRSRLRPIESPAAWAEAIESLDRAIAIDPTFGDAICERGVLRLRLGRVEGALEDLQAAARLGTAVVFCRYTIGWIHLLVREDMAAAEIEFRAAAETGPDDDFGRIAAVWRLLLRGDFDPALARCDALEGRANVAFDVAFARGYALTWLRDPAGAEAAYDRALALRPELPITWVQRARVRMARDRLEEARADVRKALEIRPEDPRALELLGLIHLRASEPRQALESLDRAHRAGGDRLASIRGNRGRAAFLVGELAQAEGRLDEARAAYLRAATDFEEVVRRGGAQAADAGRMLDETRRRLAELR